MKLLNLYLVSVARMIVVFIRSFSLLAICCGDRRRRLFVFDPDTEFVPQASAQMAGESHRR